MSSLPSLNIFVQDSVVVHSSMDSMLIDGASSILRTDPIDQWDLNDQWVSIMVLCLDQLSPQCKLLLIFL